MPPLHWATLLPFPYQMAWPNECACFRPTPRNTDTSTNQPDFSIWHCRAALDKCIVYMYVSMCVSVCVSRDQRQGQIIKGMQMEWASMLTMRYMLVIINCDGCKCEWRAARYSLQCCLNSYITVFLHIICECANSNRETESEILNNA